jgi:hypothetical protein
VLATGGSFSDPELSIREVESVAALADAQASGPTWAMSGNSFLLAVPGVARFLLTEGREITYQVERGGDPDDVTAFLLGSVFGILLHQRGQLVLHASAVEVGGRAVLFCGRSGAGKSTLAAALNKRGYPLLLDDICAVDLADGVPMAQPDGRRIKLWTQAIAALDLGERRKDRIRNRLQKFYVEPLGEVPAKPLPVAAIYDLREARPPLQPGITPANVVDSSLILRNNAFRPVLVRTMGQKGLYFEYAAALSARAGVHVLARALGFAEMDEVVGWLETHWKEAGLARNAA